MRAGSNGYGKQGIPLLASLLAEALMVGSGARPVRGEAPPAADEHARPSPGEHSATTLKGWLAGLDRWLHRQTMRRWDAYLAQSQNVFDLEERIRRLEHGDRGGL